MIRINGERKESTATVQSNEKIGTYHLADNPEIYEILRSNNFVFIIPSLDGIVRMGFTASERNSRISNADSIVRISVVSASVPSFQQSVISVRRGNSELKYAGVPTFSSGTIVCNDYIGEDTSAVLHAWQNLSYNMYTEKVGHASDYKQQCYLIMYSPDYQEVRRWKLYGCWISNITEDTMDSDNNSVHRMTATIEYDRAEIDVSDIVLS